MVGMKKNYDSLHHGDANVVFYIVTKFRGKEWCASQENDTSVKLRPMVGRFFYSVPESVNWRQIIGEIAAAQA